MKVILFGATGMVGQAALRECLLDPEVETVLSVGRAPSGRADPKLKDLVLEKLDDFSGVEAKLAGYDACFFCLGISVVGLSEDQYRAITKDIAVAAAETLVRLDPNQTFIFVSGAGADSTEKGSVMWARVKGAAENAILRMPFKRKFVFRPSIIQPLHGIRSRTASYRWFYLLFAPILPLLRWMFPRLVTTTERVGRAMLLLAKGKTEGVPPILHTAEINQVAARALVVR